MLSDKEIRKHRDNGNVVIEPFHERQLGTNSYDVRLGLHYYRESNDSFVYNTRSKSSVAQTWAGPFVAERAGDWMKERKTELEGISPDEYIIWIGPGESLLAHTQEFIGSRQKVATTMQARSSIGRSFLVVCSCSGVGDIGYNNRWTMEITNRSRHHAIPLVVGQRVAQIIFQLTDGSEKSYTANGKYQTVDDLESVIKNWTPSMMLPRMHDDWETNLPVEERPGSMLQTSENWPSV
jgi:dCTP deaminase